VRQAAPSGLRHGSGRRVKKLSRGLRILAGAGHVMGRDARQRAQAEALRVRFFTLQPEAA
jgi:hypothetical protein